MSRSLNITPSVLAADFTLLSEDVRAVDRAGPTLGCRPRGMLDPASPITWIEHVLHLVDIILMMTVNPGFGGQALAGSAMFGTADYDAAIRSLRGFLLDQGAGIAISRSSARPSGRKRQTPIAAGSRMTVPFSML